MNRLTSWPYQRLAREWLIWLALLLWLLLLHAHALAGWWRWDDPAHLFFVTQFTPSAYFLIPEVWREISPANFTPLLSLSFQADYTLFGLNPAGFYLHQLLVLWLTAGMTFMLLRLWLPPLWAGLAAALFLAGVPVLFVAHQLMTRHYAEGLLLTTLALYLFVRALRSRRHGKTVALAAAFCYLLAVLAKEVYTPLVVLLPFLHEGTLRRRLSLWLPFVAVATVYTFWRTAMLGSTGGYGVLPGIDPQVALMQLASVPLILGGPGWQGPVAVGIAATSLAAAVLWRRQTPAQKRLRRGHAILLVFLCSVLVLVPLIPLAAWPGIHTPDRYLFLPWWTLTVGTVWGLAQLRGKLQWLALSLFVTLLALTLLHMHRVAGQLDASIAEKEVQGHFIWQADDQQIIWLSSLMALSFWDYQYLAQLKQAHGKGSSPMAVSDEIQIATRQADGDLPIWRYDPYCLCMQDVSALVPDWLDNWKGRLRPDLPLDVETHLSGRNVSWQFGPHEAGQYAIIGPSIGKIPLPEQGQLRANINLEGVRLRYDSPEGWIRYSEALDFHSTDQQ